MTVRRPMLWISAAMVFGMYILAFLGASVTFTVVFCCLVTFLILAFKYKKLYTNLILALSLVSMLSGIFLYAWTDDILIKKLFPYCDKTVYLKGEVLEEPNETDKYIRFNMKTREISVDGQNYNEAKEKIQMIYFKNGLTDENINVKLSDVLSLKCTISLPDEALNTGGFDYGKFLKSKGIYFQGVIENGTISVTHKEKHLFLDKLYGFRKMCADLFDNTFPTEEGSVLKAYILGNKKHMSDEISDIFSASGLSHVLAVSGMHVTIFISCIVAFLRLVRISKRKQLLISIFSVFFYVIFTGATPSSLRAGIVCIFALTGELLLRRAEGLTALSIAAAILSVFNPHIILDSSFMLSFSATLGILLFSEKMSENFGVIYSRLDKKSKLRRIIKATCDLVAVGISANIMLTPVLIYLFKEFSIMSVIATVIINPILAPILVGGILFCAIGLLSGVLAFPIAGFIHFLTKVMILIAKIFSIIPVSKVSVGGITPFILLMYATFVVVVYFTLVKKNENLRAVSLCSLAVLFVLLASNNALNNEIAQVSFINVGQGDCSLIKIPGNCDILIDGGGKKNNNSIGENVIKPYLLKNGVRDIEYAVASHGHEDHVNGLSGLMDVFRIKNLLVPEGFGATNEGRELLLKAAEKKIKIIYLGHGDEFLIGDNIELVAVMPDRKILSLTNEENDRSLLLRFKYGDVSFLYTGDLSSIAENYAADKYPDLIDADVLKVSHHGADTSSGEKFLDVATPQYAYIPVGENVYGHPSDDTLERLKMRNVEVYRADIHKDVTFYFDYSEIYGIKYGKTYVDGGSYELR